MIKIKKDSKVKIKTDSNKINKDSKVKNKTDSNNNNKENQKNILKEDTFDYLEFKFKN